MNYAAEIGTPEGRKPILWKLVTDIEVASLEEAVEKLRWYAMRWKIEVFHKVLKSGCRAEDASAAFKCDAVRQITERGYPVSEVSQRLSVSQHRSVSGKRSFLRRLAARAVTSPGRSGSSKRNWRVSPRSATDKKATAYLARDAK